MDVKNVWPFKIQLSFLIFFYLPNFYLNFIIIVKLGKTLPKLLFYVAYDKCYKYYKLYTSCIGIKKNFYWYISMIIIHNFAISILIL